MHESCNTLGGCLDPDALVWTSTHANSSQRESGTVHLSGELLAYVDSVGNIGLRTKLIRPCSGAVRKAGVSCNLHSREHLEPIQSIEEPQR